MELVVWLAFWGAVIVAAFVWAGRRGPRVSPPAEAARRTAPGRNGTLDSVEPSAPSAWSQGSDRLDRVDREDEAFADGLILGHYLTHRYDESERAAMAEELAALQEEVEPSLLGEDGDDLWDDVEDDGGWDDVGVD